MAEFKLFTEPKFHDEAFYKDRPVSDHIQEPSHQPRLMQVLREIQYLTQEFPVHDLADYGAGNGGLLHEIKSRSLLKHLDAIGYDMQPSNIQWAKDVYQVPVESFDFTQGELPPRRDIVILAEVLEHLVEPRDALMRIRLQGTKYVIASSPANENPDIHYEFHLWAWTENSYAKMFQECGWTIEKAYVQGATQFVVASNATRTLQQEEGTRARVAEEVIRIQAGGYKPLTILECHGWNVAAFFAMNHHCFAQVDDPEEAIAAAQRFPWLKVSTREWNIDADIIVEDTKVLARETETDIEKTGVSASANEGSVSV